MARADEAGAAFPLLLLCFFLSGLAGLAYETAWTREFTFVFGTSELAVATVLAAYMGGLAAGAGLAARFAHRIRRPVLAYGVLELGIGLAALAVPLAIAASRGLYLALFGGREVLAQGLPTALFYLVASFLILLVPTGMMGATLPLLARHAVQRDDQVGRRVGVLYAVNTAGAVAGTLLAAFVLLPALGLRQTIYCAAAVNALVFLAAWGLARRAPTLPVPADGAAPLSRAGRGAWILPLVFGSGAVSFGYEVLWTRLLAHVLGGSVYAFATMLASFLAGIALGSFAASRLASSPSRAAAGFAAAQLGIAGLSVLAYAVLPWIPELGPALARADAPRGLVDVVAAALTLFPAAIAIGATYPFAVRVLARGELDAGPASARVYAANTLGSIAGSVGAGFFLIPALGYAGGFGAFAAANALLAVGAALLLAPRRPVLAALGAAALALLLLRPPSPPWEILKTDALTRRVADAGVDYLGVGRAATVLLLERKVRWVLRTNGLPESRIDPPGVWHGVQKLARAMTALAVLARPEARSVLVVGLGGGVTVEAVPSALEHIDVFELEPEVVAANRVIAERRWRDPLADPRLRLHVNDARNALLLAGRRFDAIVSQPSHPWSAGASHLYTREFFALARSRLEEGGLLVQWIGLGFVDERLFRSLLATLDDVFENVRVYTPGGTSGALLVASDGPLDIERSAGQAIEAAPDDFARVGIAVPEDVTTWLLLDEAGVRELARGAALVRDDRNLLQSESPRVLDRALLGARADALVAPLDPLVPARLDGQDAFYVLRKLPRRRAQRFAAGLEDPVDLQVGEALLALEQGRPVSARALLAKALAEAPRHREARAALLRLSRRELESGAAAEDLVEAPLDEPESAVVAGWRAVAAGSDGALRALEPSLAALPPRHPLLPDAARLRVGWRLSTGTAERAREAVEILDAAVLSDDRDPVDLLLRAEACEMAGDPLAVLDTLAIVAERLAREAGGSRALARQGLRLALAAPQQPDLESLREQVIGLLRGQAERGAPLRGAL